MKRYIVFIFLLLSIGSSWAQNQIAPVPVEVNFGEDNFSMQMIIKKNFTPESKLYLFSIATFNADYKNSAESISVVLPMQVNYSLNKNWSLMSGLDVNSHAGIHPLLGIQHNVIKQNLMTITSVSVIPDSENSYKLFGLYEYKPTLNENYSLYSAIRMMYVHDMSNHWHSRSFIYSRLGIQRKQYAYGLSLNFDYFGPTKKFKRNAGLFVKYNF